MDSYGQHALNRWQELADLLGAWDPLGIGVMVGLPCGDTYDRLVNPLIALLEQGRPVVDLIAFIERELRDYFGIDPAPCRPEMFAARAVEWF